MTGSEKHSYSNAGGWLSHGFDTGEKTGQNQKNLLANIDYKNKQEVKVYHSLSLVHAQRV